MMSRLRPIPVLLLLCSVLAAATGRAQGVDPNACDDPSESPNVIVGDLHQLNRYGAVGGITGFSVGTTSCNLGTCWLNWITGSGANQHPTIGQNMFRLKDGRFEQLGQSWLKHGFYALSENVCSPDCIPTDGEHLGVNCSDPYSADLNGQQTRLGPKFEVNPVTGNHPHPVTDQAMIGDEIYKRLQVHDVDLDPALNPGARWYVEGQYVAEDDAGAGNQNDNASYREVEAYVRMRGGFSVRYIAETQRTKPGIVAWQDADPTVSLITVDDPQGGRFYVAGQATDLGGGWWHYEYAVQNLTSDRAARTFAVPLPAGATVSAIDFHDVDYHSGEPFDGAPWVTNGGVGGEITWSTATHAENLNANALRWGTLYNFRFDCDVPPETSTLGIGLFKPGSAGEADALSFSFLAPRICDGDGTCDPGENCLSCPGECADVGPDADGDGVNACTDCDDASRESWGVPGEVPMLMVAKAALGAAAMSWGLPGNPGGEVPRYEALRSPDPSDFTARATCLRDADPTRRGLLDPDAPIAGPRLYYLVRARTACPVSSPGTTGGNSFGVERSAADCP